MWTTTEVLRLGAAIVAALLGAVLLRGPPRDRSALASVLVLAGVVAHLVFLPLLRHGAPALLTHATLLLSLCVPPAFWLLAHVHFADDFRLRPVHLVLAGAFLATAYVSWLATGPRALPGALFEPEQDRFWTLLPKVLALVIVLHALLRVYTGAGTDLVLPRLRARFALLVASGTYVLVELAGETLFSGSRSAALAETAHRLAVLVLIFAVALVSLRVAPEVLVAPRGSLDGPALDPASDRGRAFTTPTRPGGGRRCCSTPDGFWWAGEDATGRRTREGLGAACGCGRPVTLERHATPSSAMCRSLVT